MFNRGLYCICTLVTDRNCWYMWIRCNGLSIIEPVSNFCLKAKLCRESIACFYHLMLCMLYYRRASWQLSALW
jgi:hypothetical protein